MGPVQEAGLGEIINPLLAGASTGLLYKSAGKRDCGWFDGTHHRRVVSLREPPSTKQATTIFCRLFSSSRSAGQFLFRWSSLTAQRGSGR